MDVKLRKKKRTLKLDSKSDSLGHNSRHWRSDAGQKPDGSPEGAHKNIPRIFTASNRYGRRNGRKAAEKIEGGINEPPALFYIQHSTVSHLFSSPLASSSSSSIQ